MSELQGEWVECIVDKDYEIYSEYPHPIRRKNDYMVLKISKGPGGYPVVTLNTIQHYLHRIVAQQFVPNPRGLEFVDHINGDRSNYSVENLRFVSRKENAWNRNYYKGIRCEFVDELEEGAYPIEVVGDWDFERYYVKDDVIYVFDGVKYRIVLKHPCGRQWKVYMKDATGKLRGITKRRLETSLSEFHGVEFDLH